MDALRDQRGIPWLDDLARDVRHGIRSLRRTPVLTTVALVTLAVGIGANTAIFTIVNGVLLRPLAYPSPAQLVYLNTRLPALGFPQFPVSVAEYLEFQQFNTSFADLGAFRMGEANLMAGDRAVRVRSAVVDRHLLATLGVRPVQGRLFTADETGQASPSSVAIVSFELWQSALGAQSMVGRSVVVDGQRLQVVGVMAPGADLMDQHPEIWLPLAFTEVERGERNNHDLSLIGRLRPEVTMAAAQTELDALILSWSARVGIHPGEDHAGHVFVPGSKGGDGHVLQMVPLADRVLGGARRSIWLLQAAVLLVLLIAGANVASLLLARAETRQRELAVRAALGASRGRLLRQSLTESAVLSVAGGALGVLLAHVGVAALVRAYPGSLPRLVEVAVDLPVMLVSLVVATVCGLLFGIAPRWHDRSWASTDALGLGSRGSTDRSPDYLRPSLVVAETALAVMVVAGAGLLLRTVENLTAADAGFDRSRLLTFSITLPPNSSGLLGRVAAYQRILEQLRRTPGVRRATAMTDLPLESPLSSFQTEIAHPTVAGGTNVPTVHCYERVMSDYFETMGIEILQGRGFRAEDAATTGRTVVVNETLAQTYWPGQNPIGQQLRPCCGDGGNPWFSVIGVAKDVRQAGVDQPAGSEAYLLVEQLATDSPTTWVAISPTMMHVAVRTTLPLATLAPTLSRVVHEVDPAVPVARLREMDTVFAESIRGSKMLAQLIAVFAALALLLATVGTYGVLSYRVAERRREIGIRMALGASRSRVLAQVMEQGLGLTAAGIATGLAGALVLNRLLASLLFGVRPTDPPTLVAVAATIALVGSLACWLPAFRASRLDPSEVLRAD